MAISLFKKNSKIINLEIKDYVIRYVDVKLGKHPIVQHFGEVFIPTNLIKDGKILDFDTLKMILEQHVQEWKIARREVRFLVPDESFIMRRLRIPKEIADNEIEGYIYLQLGSTIHLPFEDPFFDIHLLGEVEDEKELLLFAAPEDIILQYCELLEECKLKPVVADISSLAIYRLYNSLETNNPNEHLLILQFSLYDVNASIFHQHKPTFVRQISISAERDLWEKSGSRMEKMERVFIKDEGSYFELIEDTYNEIERVLRFYKYNLHNGKAEVTKVLITGDHPFLERIKEDIKNRFDIHITTIHDDHIVIDQQQNIKKSSFFLPIGLGLRGGK